MWSYFRVYHEKILTEGDNINNVKEFYNNLEKYTKQRKKSGKKDFLIITDIIRKHDYITFISDQNSVSILISDNIYL